MFLRCPKNNNHAVHNVFVTWKTYLKKNPQENAYHHSTNIIWKYLRHKNVWCCGERTCTNSFHSSYEKTKSCKLIKTADIYEKSETKFLYFQCLKNFWFIWGINLWTHPNNTLHEPATNIPIINRNLAPTWGNCEKRSLLVSCNNKNVSNSWCTEFSL